MALREVEVPAATIERLAPVVGATRYGALVAAAATAARQLAGATLWNVSSTAAGGGVAEMLQVLLGYTRGAGIDTRWVVLEGDRGFFAVTKRLHNRLHGVAGDGGELAEAEADHYAAVTAANAAELAPRVRRGDVVLLHDPQTAGMAAVLAQAGARVVWRCHIGSDHQNEHTNEAWALLRPYLEACEASVFSLRSYVPEFLDERPAFVIPPSIDPFAPKNQPLAPETVTSILQRIGLVAGTPGTTAFTRRDGTTGAVRRPARIVSSARAPLDPDVPVVLQVSRWDRLKDMAGVLAGFAEGVAGRSDADLVLAGPSPAEVSDDPESVAVLAECAAAYEALGPAVRRRVRLVELPMDDLDENAAMVNALQRHATVVVQKSLAEGFGLTVAEAMWKARATVASHVGGIGLQVAEGTGVLLEDPSDLAAFGDVVTELLRRPDAAARLGAAGHRRVRDEFLEDRHLVRYAGLVDWLSSH